MLNRPLVEFFNGDMRVAAAAAIAEARAGGCGRFPGLLRARSGQERWWDIAVTPITGADGAVVQLLAISRDITERRRDEAVRAAHQHVLGMIATGSALGDVLDSLVRLVEQQANGMQCSVLLLGEDGIHVRHCAAPSLPAGYVRAIDGAPIGPRAGSCGTAMHRGTPVFVTDILTDPLWDDYRELAQQFGLRACWSMPICSPQGQPLGSFAMYYAEPRSPNEVELGLIESAADIARIAIEHQRAHQALHASEARNRAMLRAIPDWVFLTTVDGVFLDYHARDTSRLHMPPSAFLGRSVAEVLPPPVGEVLTRAFARVAASDEPEQLEYVMGAEDAERFYEACIVRCDGDKILSIVKDITDRKRNEIDTDAQRRELAHLSRVATLGELTGTLAHELSQPLTAVRSNAQAAWHLLAREPLDQEELRAALEDIIRNNRRAGAVIDRLRALLRKESTAFQPVDVNDVVRDVIDLAHGEILSRRISLTSRLTSGGDARAGRSHSTAAGAPQPGAECLRCDERGGLEPTAARAGDRADRWPRAAGSLRRRPGDPRESARTRVRAVRHVPAAGPRPGARHQPLDRQRPRRLDSRREQRRRRRDVPLPPAGRRGTRERVMSTPANCVASGFSRKAAAVATL